MKRIWQLTFAVVVLAPAALLTFGYSQEKPIREPDVIFVPNYYEDMVQIARQAKPIGMPGTMFVGGDGWDSQDLLEGAGNDGRWPVLFSSLWITLTSGGRFCGRSLIAVVHGR